MRSKISVCVVVFLAGSVAGILFQKYYGAGRLLVETGIRDASNSPHPIPKESHGRLSVFVLAGQSNMSGRGELDGESETDPGVFVFGNDFRWRLGSEPVDSPEGQVDWVSIDNAGVGPGMAFGVRMRELDESRTIGLVPCAKGNSSIVEWQRGLSGHSLYGSMLKRARAASVMGEIRGILFFQGETETLSDAADGWKDGFEQFVSDIRSDLGNPELPVVFARLGTNTKPDLYVNWDRVKEQQSSVNLPSVSMISTDDLSLQDEVHFTSESYREIGVRFADAIHSITSVSQSRRSAPEN